MNKADRMFKVQSLEEVEAVAKALLAWENDKRVWLLEGEMGAGKTTLIRALCRQLGVADNVSSPTFSLVNEYATSQGAPVYHFDFYRMEPQEAERAALEFEEYFDSGNYCFVEWPSKMLSFDAFCPLHLLLEVQADGRRVYVTS